MQEREVRPVGEERPVPVNVRILAATHRDLAAEVREGRFRHDLFYRLNVVTLHVPSLRERPEDVPLLAEHFTRRFADRFGLGDVRLSDRVVRHLQAQPWPGNVRELEHAIERLVALSAGPEIDELPEPSAEAEPLGLKERVAAFERGLVAEALAAEGGNQSAAARRLGVSRVTLIDKMQRYGLR
jgi:two-component system response regulator HydG